jgi:hypothetical protein
MEMENTGRGGSIARSQYLIDRFRVVFEWGGGWNCACADFVSSNACRHTREAAGRRAAQAQIAERVRAARSHVIGAGKPRRTLIAADRGPSGRQEPRLIVPG